MARGKTERNNRRVIGTGKAKHDVQRKVLGKRKGKPDVPSRREDTSVSSDDDESHASSSSERSENKLGASSGGELQRILESLAKSHTELAKGNAELVKGNAELLKGNTEMREEFRLLATAIQQRIIPTVRTMYDCPAAATAATNQFSFLAKLAKSFMAGTQEYTIPTTVHTTDNSRAATTITGSGMDTDDMIHALKQPNTKSELRRKLHKYIKERVFKGTKFPITANETLQVCQRAVETGAVQLPEGVPAGIFAQQFSGLVKPRLRELRNYCQDLAKKKFTSKCLFVK